MRVNFYSDVGELTSRMLANRLRTLANRPKTLANESLAKLIFTSMIWKSTSACPNFASTKAACPLSEMK